MKSTTLLAAILSFATAAVAGGCQPKQSEFASTRPAPREPMHRVEVMSRSSAQLADSIVGRKCRVQFRRDALGLAGNTMADLSGRWSAVAAVDGTVLDMTDQWLVVQAPGKRVVVPHASILVIELQD